MSGAGMYKVSNELFYTALKGDVKKVKVVTAILVPDLNLEMVTGMCTLLYYG